jgi:hypothetical protein
MLTRSLALLTFLTLVTYGAHAQASSGGIHAVTDYGAVGDGVTDDGPAVKAATLAAVNDGGGVIYFPRGQFRFGSSVTVNIGYANLVFRGDGGSISRIIPDVGSTTLDMISLTSSSVNVTVTFENLAIVGKRFNNNRSVFRVYQGGFSSTHVRDISFYGVSTDDGIVVVTGGTFIVERIGMHDVTSRLHGMIYGIQNFDMKVSHFRGSDYYSLNNFGASGFSSGSGTCCRAWIEVLPPQKYDWRTASGHVLIEDVIADEGPEYIVLAGDFAHTTTNADTRGRSLVVRRVWNNHSSITGAVGVYAYNWDNVVVSDYSATWSSKERDLVYCKGVGACVVQRLTGETNPTTLMGPNSISADTTTQFLKVDECNGVTVTSQAQRTEQIVGGVDTWAGTCRPAPTYCE